MFTKNLPELLHYIHDQGYECTLGDAYRSPKAFGKIGEKGPYGHPKSAHKRRLAIDLNLFKDGRYLRKTSDHAKFGEFWKRLHPLNRWGGDFKKPDGNHYSIVYGGTM